MIKNLNMKNIEPNNYLIVKHMSDTTINHGIDPVTATDIKTTIKGSISILDSRKTLKGAISIRDKKYKNALIIPSY
jgi:hypothetical protein